MRFPLITLLIAFLYITANAQTTTETGVSRTLADYRAKHISNTQYTLDLIIPADKNTDIKAAETLTFDYKPSGQDLQLDFKEDPIRIKAIAINGKLVPVNFSKEHILLEAKYLLEGKNNVSFQFL